MKFKISNLLERIKICDKKVFFAIHHKISMSLYMSNHISLVCVWINCMSPL
jgi:hypothetical protein